jgi:hypothetical protein
MLTIVSARFSNPDGTAVLAMTEEFGSVLITDSTGKAEKKAALDAWVAAGGVIAPFVVRATVKQRDLAAEIDAIKAQLAAGARA